MLINSTKVEAALAIALQLIVIEDDKSRTYAYCQDVAERITKLSPEFRHVKVKGLADRIWGGLRG